ncbi:MAG TPA: hypothetical protein PKK00_11500 [Bacteroidales bacterium]|nr:hypothetical protein [Bacteroidales bacterium]HPS18176.1 hypothetical protein [Bacteroidales bacterium]
MRTTSILFALFMFANLCFGQTQNVSSKQKNKIVLKITTIQKEVDAPSVDRILIQCENIYSSKTSFSTGLCVIIAESKVTLEDINKRLSRIGQVAEQVSIKEISDEEITKEGIILNDGKFNTNKNQ